MLQSVEWLKLPISPNGDTHSYQAYVCLFRPEEPTLRNVDRISSQRNDLMMRLEENGIATRQGTHSPVIQGYYAEKYHLRPDEFPNAYIADRLSLTLPLYVQLTQAEQELVSQNLRKGFENA